MNSVQFTTPPGQAFYRAEEYDPQRSATNENLRLAVCRNALFKKILTSVGLGHLPPDKICISVDFLDDGTAPIIWFWEKNTGQKFPIDFEIYKRDPFLRQYAFYQTNLSDDPPLLDPPAEQKPSPSDRAPNPPAPPPSKTDSPPLSKPQEGIPPSVLENIVKAQLAAQQEQLRTFQAMSQKQSEQNKAAEDRYLHLLGASDQNFRELLNRIHAVSMEARNQSEWRAYQQQEGLGNFMAQMQNNYAGLAAETQRIFAALVDRSERRSAMMTAFMTEFTNAVLSGVLSHLASSTRTREEAAQRFAQEEGQRARESATAREEALRNFMATQSDAARDFMNTQGTQLREALEHLHAQQREAQAAQERTFTPFFQQQREQLVFLQDSMTREAAASREERARSDARYGDLFRELMRERPIPPAPAAHREPPAPPAAARGAAPAIAEELLLPPGPIPAPRRPLTIPVVRPVGPPLFGRERPPQGGAALPGIAILAAMATLAAARRPA